MKQPRAFVTASLARGLTVGLIAVRAKAVALLLGPEGTGLLGLYTAAQEIGAQAADAGLSHSAVRQIARTADRPARAARLRRALAVATVALAAIGAASMALARAPLARMLTGDETQVPVIGILAAGLFLTVLARWRQALLTGYRQVGALAWGSVLGTGLATAAGIGLIWAFGRNGLVWAAIAVPAGALLALTVLGRVPAAPPPIPGLARDWAVLARLGVSLMLVAQMALLAPMVLRVWLTHQGGLAEAGLFQAAWTVSAQIMAVLLMAVGIDFYPRLSAMIGDRRAAATALERQIQLHLAAGGPVLVLTVGLAPWALPVLYSESFQPAALLLQGLAIGNLARLISAPLETVLTAEGRPRTVLAIGGITLGALLAGTLAGSERWGLAGIGIAFAAAQLLQLVLLGLASRWRTGLAPGRWALLWMAGLTATALLVQQAPPVAAAPVAGLLGLICWRARPRRIFGLIRTGGRRSSAALNRLKVWLT